MNFPGFLARRCRPAVLAVSAALLAACGGGTSQVEVFVAERLVAFGDESSVLTSGGYKYSVNQLTDTDALDCAARPIWVQYLATAYGMVFAECNPTNIVDPKAKMRAVADARVAGLAAQIDAHLGDGGFGADAMATVLIGANDVLDLYGQFGTSSRAELLDEARQRGVLIGRQVNRLVDLDVRVIVSTVPDVGKTPFAIAEKAANTDTDRAALLSDLTYQLNAGLRTTVLNDGRYVGLVLADEMIQAMAISPASFSLSNVTSVPCTVALPACTTDTLVTGVDPLTWLWADATRMGYGGQNRLGLLAVSRARGNPF